MRLLKTIRGERGAEIAEAALVMPVVFLFLLGIIWFGRAFNIYSTIQQAAHQGALVAARPTCATCGNASASDGSVTACPNPTVACAVAGVMQASNIDPTAIPVDATPPAPLFCPIPTGGACTKANNITICRQVLLNPSASATQPPVCGTLVSFQYPFQFYLPFTALNLKQITLTAQAESRMEN